MAVYKSNKKRKDGKPRWGYNIYVPNEATGKGDRVTKETFRTQKEARNAERAMLKRIEEKSYDPVLGERKERVEDLFDDFIDHYATTGVRESSVDVLERSMRKHFVSHFEGHLINQISSVDLSNFFSDLSTKLVNHRKYKYPISQFFELAIKKKIIVVNPMDTLPKLTESVNDKGDKTLEEIPVHYKENELVTVLELMKEHLNSKQYTYFLLLSYTGLRKSEALALHKDDINLETMRITIDKTLSRDRHSKVIVSEGTKGSNRNTKVPTVFPLDPILKEPLQNYIDTTDRYNETEFFFPSHHPKSKGHLSMSTPDKWLRGFFDKHEDELKEAGVNHRITVHGFRHSYISMLQAKNYNPNVVMYLGRHADLTTTYVYSHFDVDTITDLMDIDTKKEDEDVTDDNQ